MVKKEKSPSQRLRNTLFKVWEWLSNDFKAKFNNSFDSYYKFYIEKLISKLKEEL